MARESAIDVRFTIFLKCGMHFDSPVALIEQTGQALYGERWQAQLSRDLGIKDRTMRYWIDGTNTPPEDVLIRLHAIACRAQAKLGDIIKDLAKAMPKEKKA